LVNYDEYIANIDKKRNYVENVLGAKFEFIQKALTPKERMFVEEYRAPYKK
jgi:hypothetical protein